MITVNIISNIKEEFEEKTGLPGIPQAGLFVRYEGFYDTHADEIDEYLNINLSNFTKNDDILSEMVLGVEKKLK